MNNFQEFIQWEVQSRDTIDFKKIYVDMAGSVNAGLMLSEIIYWYLPTKNGESKLRVFRDDYHWIAVRRYDWWERTRLSPKEADGAIALLIKNGIIIKELFKFNGDPTVHLRINEAEFLAQLNHLQTHPLQNPYTPKGKSDIPQKVKTKSPKTEIPVTETTPETTPETLSSDDGSDKPPKPRDLMFDLIVKHWQMQGSRVGTFKKFFQGGYVRTGNRKDDQRNAEWIKHSEELVALPLSVAELGGFITWYLGTAGDVLPEAPDKLATWIYRFRLDPEHDLYVQEATPAALKPSSSPPPPATPPAGEMIDAAAEYDRIVNDLAQALDGDR